MKNKYLFILADLRLPCSFVEIDYPEPRTEYGTNKFNRQVEELLDCSIYESVWIYSDLVMLVDDCGKLKDKPINLRSSRFYRGTAYGDPIVGYVLSVAYTMLNLSLTVRSLPKRISVHCVTFIPQFQPKFQKCPFQSLLMVLSRSVTVLHWRCSSSLPICLKASVRGLFLCFQSN